jgi:hypothetical protein
MPEPEFLKILKCNSAESESAGFRFNYFYSFNGKTFSRGNWTTFQVCSDLYRRIFFNQNTKTVTCPSPVVHSDLWKDSSLLKVDFSACSKCFSIRARVRIQDCPKTVRSSAKEPLNILFLIGMTNENCQIQRYQFYSWSFLKSARCFSKLSLAGLHLFDIKNGNVCSMTCIYAVSEKCNMIKMHTLYYGMNLWKYVISYTIQSDWTISKRATLHVILLHICCSGQQ